MKPNTNTAARILTAISARSETPLTAKQLAAFTSRHPISIAKTLKPLRESGQVVRVENRMTGKRGRPAFRYSVPVIAQ